MIHAALSCVLALSCMLVLSCSQPPPGEAVPPKDPAPARWGAAVTVAGGGAVAGDVLFVDEKGKVVERAPIANGRYELAAAPAATRAVVRLESPVIGVREVAIAKGAKTAPAIAIAEADIARVRGGVELPAGVAFDWVELNVTPAPDGIEPAVVLWSDAQGSLRGSMIQRKLASRTFDLALLRGVHRINALRVVDGPKGSAGTALGLDKVQLGAATTPSSLAGATVKVDGPAEAKLYLRVLADSER